MMNTMTQISPVVGKENTISFANNSPTYSPPQQQSSRKKNSKITQDFVIDEEIIPKKPDSTVMKKILSMPCDPAKDISIETG